MSQGSDQRHDAALPRDQRRARGLYYTPDAIVQYIVGQTLTIMPATILDPACGDGAFLVEAAKRLRQQKRFRLDTARRCLFGIDRDEVAIAQARTDAARALLGQRANQRRVHALAQTLATNIITANALLDPLPADWPQAFDAVVGNPPYVNIRRLAREPELVKQYRQRFRCARGNFDLYVLFIERALELLRPGGRCGLIVPNKLATLDYAATTRVMLIEQTQLETVTDFSEQKVFAAASVYPHVIVFQKIRPPPQHRVRIVRPSVAAAVRVPAAEVGILTNSATVMQSDLNRRGVFDWIGNQDPAAQTRPLGELCRLHSGTTGFIAQEIAAQLSERREGQDDTFPFITSGNIDRYAVRIGDVRYMKRQFADPVLSRDCPLLSPAKQTLFAGGKIVFAGMSQRLEAAWHAGPLALGVQVFAAAEIQVDPFYLLALLNSAWLSQLFRERFSAKRLSGGYFSVNKGQLAQLPIVDPQQLSRSQGRVARKLAALGKQLSDLGPDPALDCEVDTLVERLYGRLDSMAA